MALPSGFTLDQPAPAPTPQPQQPQTKLPAGFTLDQPQQPQSTEPAATGEQQPEQPSNGLFDVIKGAFSGLTGMYDSIKAAQDDVDQKFAAGDYSGALKSAFLHGMSMAPQSQALMGMYNQAQQTSKAAEEGNVPETVEHAVGMVPILGPSAVDMTEDIKHGRYAEAAGKGLSYIIPELSESALGKIDTAALSDTMKASAEKTWQKVLNPTTKINKALVEDKIAPGLIDRNVKASSLEDLQDQAQGHLHNYGQQIDDYFDTQAANGTTMDPKPIINRLQDAKDDAMVDGVSLNESYTDKLDSLKKQIQSIAKKNGGTVPLDKLRKIRSVNDQAIAQSKNGFALAPDAYSQVSAVKEYTNAIRESFANEHPDLAKINKEFSFWKDVDKVTGDTLTRRVGQRPSLMKKFAQQIGGGIGAATGASVAGAHGAALGTEAGYLAAGKLAQIQDSALWNSHVPIPIKMRVSQLAQSGNLGDALTIAIEAMGNMNPAATSNK